MFKFIRRLFYLAIILIVLVIILILVFPNQYQKESTIEILASVEKTYKSAEQLSQWNLMAMLGGATSVGNTLPDQAKLPTGQLDQLMGDLKNQIGGMDIKVTIVKSDISKLLIYRVDGGPMSGIQPELYFYKVDDNKTRVVYKESFIFTGWFGSVKAFLAKYGTEKIIDNSLANLKKISEQN
jgi:hypothetical protein